MSSDYFFNRRGKVLRAKYASKVGASCCRCERVAFYRVGAKGYCREHLSEAKAHTKHLNAMYATPSGQARVRARIDDWVREIE